MKSKDLSCYTWQEIAPNCSLFATGCHEMPKTSNIKFTDRYILGLKATDIHYERADSGARGLNIRVSPDGTKIWRVSYSFDGKRQRRPIGEHPRMSLADARARRDEVFDGLRRGVDILEATTQEARASHAFEKVAEEFIQRHVEEKSDDPDDAARIIRKEFVAVWGSRDIRTIKKPDIHKVLDAIVDRGAPVSANRALARVRKLFRWCVSRGILETPPTYAIGMPTQETARERVLKPVELVKLWRTADEIGYPFGHFFKLLLLAGQRRENVAGMRWDALDGDLWSLGTKTTAHLLPLPKAALAVLADLPRLAGSPYVFPSNKLSTHITTYSDAKEALHSSGVKGGTFHDLRRTMASTLPALGVDETVSEMIQNHRLPGTKVSTAGRVYNRYKYVPQQREALEKWADYVAGLTS